MSDKPQYTESLNVEIRLNETDDECRKTRLAMELRAIAEQIESAPEGDLVTSGSWLGVDFKLSELYAPMNTIDAWAAQKDVKILDYDGFRGCDRHTLITEEEFDKGVVLCTIMLKPREEATE